jgi:hypothetical protein
MVTTGIIIYWNKKYTIPHNSLFIVTYYLMQHVSACMATISYYTYKIRRERLSAKDQSLLTVTKVFITCHEVQGPLTPLNLQPKTSQVSKYGLMTELDTLIHVESYTKTKHFNFMKNAIRISESHVNVTVSSHECLKPVRYRQANQKVAYLETWWTDVTTSQFINIID